MRYCDNCGYELHEGDVFCEQCGKKVDGTAEGIGPEVPEEGYSPRRKNNMPAVLISAALILCIGGFIVWYILKPETDGPTERTSAKQAESTGDIAKGKEKDNVEGGGAVSEEAASIELSAEPSTLNPYHKVPVATAGASSVVEQEGHNNTAAMTLDGLEETSWQEGVAGPGIGEQIWYELEEEYAIKYFSFKLGNWRDGSYYAGNHRPRVVRITVGNETADVTFPDGMEEYWVTLSSPCKADSIVLEIRDVYEGNKWDDTCIAEVGIYGE